MILGRFSGLEKKGKHVLLWERNPLFEFEMMMMPHEEALAGSIIDSVAGSPGYGQGPGYPMDNFPQENPRQWRRSRKILAK
jgi:hypothetical protein